MEQSIMLILAKPVNDEYYEMGVNNLERMRWIHRDKLRHFLADNVSRDLMSIRDISSLVGLYKSFVVDISNDEFYELEIETEAKDITAGREKGFLHQEKKETIIDKISKKASEFKLNIKK